LNYKWIIVPIIVNVKINHKILSLEIIADIQSLIRIVLFIQWVLINIILTHQL